MDRYVLDANALIMLYEHFANEFNKLRRLIASDRVKISEGVYRELRRKSDKLFRRVDKWRKDYQQFVLFISQDQQLRMEVARIEQAYGEKISVGGIEHKGFWKSQMGRKAVDSQVVAIGKVLSHTVVSDDEAVQLACMLENVRCIGWTEFARQIGMSQQQLKLL